MTQRSRTLKILVGLFAALAFVLAACGPAGGGEGDVYPLTVEVDGNGMVDSDPAGISTSGTATADFAAGTDVTLTAVPDEGATFTAWGGACDGAVGNTCVVTMDEAKTATATFTMDATGPFAVDVTKAGSGTGVVTSVPTGIDCGEDCSEEFAEGTLVTLTATADAGSTFAGWTGCDSATDNECTVTVDAAESVTATFAVEGEGTAATFNILETTDDAEEYLNDHATNPAFPTGSVQTLSSDLDLNYAVGENVGTVVGLRYGNVTIPQGSTIVSASITFAAEAPGEGVVTYTIVGQDSDTADTFAYGDPDPATFGITTRPETTAAATWTSDTPWGDTATTSDISAVIQEIVDRDGWVSGNALALFISADVMNAENYRVAESFSGGTAPVLNVSYIAPEAP